MEYLQPVSQSPGLLQVSPYPGLQLELPAVSLAPGSAASLVLPAYLHLSVVAALVDPLPISQISELLGPDESQDVETVLMQLRSVMDIPTDSSFPVNIIHSFVSMLPTPRTAASLKYNVSRHATLYSLILHSA